MTTLYAPEWTPTEEQIAEIREDNVPLMLPLLLLLPDAKLWKL